MYLFIERGLRGGTHIATPVQRIFLSDNSAPSKENEYIIYLDEKDMNGE